MPLTHRFGHCKASTITGAKAITNRHDSNPGIDLRRRRLAVWGGTAALMVLPLIPLHLSGGDGVDPGDFIFLAILLAGVGAAYEVAAWTSDSRALRTAIGIGIAAILLQAWINLAVGIIGSEDNPANLIYALVIAVPVCGAAAVGLRPHAMALVMVAAAIAQALAFVAALVAGLGFTGPITIFFCALWLISAALFRRAATGVNDHSRRAWRPGNEE